MIYSFALDFHFSFMKLGALDNCVAGTSLQLSWIMMNLKKNVFQSGWQPCLVSRWMAVRSTRLLMISCMARMLQAHTSTFA